MAMISARLLRDEIRVPSGPPPGLLSPAICPDASLPVAHALIGGICFPQSAPYIHSEPFRSLGTLAALIRPADNALRGGPERLRMTQSPRGRGADLPGT